MWEFLNLPPKQGQKHDICRALQEAAWGISQTFLRQDNSLGKKKRVKNRSKKKNTFLYLTRPGNINMQVQGNG